MVSGRLLTEIICGTATSVLTLPSITIKTDRLEKLRKSSGKISMEDWIKKEDVENREW